MTRKFPNVNFITDVSYKPALQTLEPCKIRIGPIGLSCLPPLTLQTTLSFEDRKNDYFIFLVGQCSTNIDTVFSWIGNGRTYFFKGSNTWRFDDTKSESEKRFPKSIATQWIGVPNNIDEAFLWGGNWVTYFFKVRFAMA